MMSTTPPARRLACVKALHTPDHCYFFALPLAAGLVAGLDADAGWEPAAAPDFFLPVAAACMQSRSASQPKPVTQHLESRVLGLGFGALRPAVPPTKLAASLKHHVWPRQLGELFVGLE